MEEVHQRFQQKILQCHQEKGPTPLALTKKLHDSDLRRVKELIENDDIERARDDRQVKKYDIMCVKIEGEVAEKLKKCNRSTICNYNRTVWSYPWHAFGHRAWWRDILHRLINEWYGNVTKQHLVPGPGTCVLGLLWDMQTEEEPEVPSAQVNYLKGLQLQRTGRWPQMYEHSNVSWHPNDFHITGGHDRHAKPTWWELSLHPELPWSPDQICGLAPSKDKNCRRDSMHCGWYLLWQEGATDSPIWYCMWVC